MNTTKILGTPILKNISEQLLCENSDGEEGFSRTISWKCHFHRQIGKFVFYTFSRKGDSVIEIVFLNDIMM